MCLVRGALTLMAYLPLKLEQDVQDALEAMQELLIADMVWMQANSRRLVGAQNAELERCAVQIVKKDKQVHIEGKLDFSVVKTYTTSDYDPIRFADYGIAVLPTSVGIFYAPDLDTAARTETL